MAKKHRVKSRFLHRLLSAGAALLLIGSVSYFGVTQYRSGKAAVAGSIYISPNQGSFTVGSTVSVTVNESSGTSAVDSVQFALTYNASQLQYVSMAEGDFPAIFRTETSTPGIIKVARAVENFSKLSGTHPVTTLNFKVVGSSGSTTLAFNADETSLTAGGQNIAQSLTGATYSLQGAPAPPPPAPTSNNVTLSLSPANASLSVGASLPLTLRLSSPTQQVFSVESVITYPADKLQYIGTTNSAIFPLALLTKNQNGEVMLMRGTAPGGVGFQGTDTVATLTFKVLNASGPVNVGIKNTSGAYNGGGANLISSVSGGCYGACSTPPPPPQPQAQSSGGNTARPPIYPTKNAQITPGNSSTASINGDATQINGSVDIQPVVDAAILAANPNDSIIKVEYLVNGELLAGKTEPPFSYSLDTKRYKNGEYQLVIKTFYKSGAIDTANSKIAVKNPVTLTYILTNYATGILVMIIAGVIIGIVAWKLLLPRFGGGGPAAMMPVSPMGLTGAAASPARDEVAYQAPEPTLVTPAGTKNTHTPIEAVLTPEQTQAAAQTDALVELPSTFTPQQSDSAQTVGQGSVDINRTPPRQ